MSFIYIVLSLLIIFFENQLNQFLIEVGFSWTLSALTPWILILVLSVATMLKLRSSFRPQKWKWSFFLLPFVLLGLNFAVNPIYEADYIKKGEALNIDEHVLLNEIENESPNFDGLVSIADINCGFCKLATKTRLNVMKERFPELDIAITLNTTDQNQIDRFKKETSSNNLNFIKIDKSLEVIKLAGGSFPTFVYVKNRKIIHRWKNNEFGFPALDWIESNLE
ncbi:MAG: hypothetical protein WED10_07540 [Brumimicrobium sp.]